MFKLAGERFILVETVFNTDTIITRDVCINLNLIEKRYKRIYKLIEGCLHKQKVCDYVEIYHNKEGKMSFGEESGILVKSIYENEIFFISNKTLREYKEDMKYLDDNLSLLEGVCKRELFKTI